MAGTSELMIGKMLGHAAGSKATHIYRRLSIDAVQGAVERTLGPALFGDTKAGAPAPHCPTCRCGNAEPAPEHLMIANGNGTL